MRCNLVRSHMRSHKGGVNVRFSNMRVAHAILAVAVLTTTPLFAQPTTSSTLPTTQGKSVFVYVNELADLSRAGNADATRELAHQTFRNNGIPTQIADAFGFTDRIVQAEVAYQNGMHIPVHEADIVKAVNNLVNTVRAPAWVRTNQAEVRKMRMRLLTVYPRLIASQEPPDDHGRYKALSENMRPVEAAYIAICLLYQKHYNADFQFTDEEKAQNAKLDSQTVKGEHLQRTQSFGSLLSGQSSQVSERDLLTAADYFFDDLGIEQTANIGTAERPASSGSAMQKGVR
jgi:hypothetical protein